MLLSGSFDIDQTFPIVEGASQISRRAGETVADL